MFKIIVYVVAICLVGAQNNSTENDTNVNENITLSTTESPLTETEENSPTSNSTSSTSEPESAETQLNVTVADTTSPQNENVTETIQEEPLTQDETTSQRESTTQVTPTEEPIISDSNQTPESQTDSTKLTFTPVNDTTETPISKNETLPSPPTEEADHMQCWWEDDAKLVAVILSLTTLCLVVMTGYARYRGYCLCNNYEDIARRGLASSNGEYQQNNGEHTGFKNDSYDPL